MRIRSAASFALVFLLAVTCDKATPVAPAGTTITLSANPTEISVDGESTLTAIVRKEDGTPVNPGTEVTFSTTEGQVDPEVVATDERGTARSTLSGLGRIGLATVTATSGAAGDVSVDIQIGRPPALLELSVSRVSIPRDLPPEGVTIDLLAIVFDGASRRQANVSVIFASEAGTIPSSSTNSAGQTCGRIASTDENGEACAELTIVEDDLLALGEAFFLVSASVPSDEGLELIAEVEIDVFTQADRIVLQPAPTTVPEGGGTVDLVALVQNANGRPVEGAGVNFLTDLGILASGGANVATGADGRAIDQLSVTAQDVASIGTPTFAVRAQTTGSAGQVLESVFALRIQGDIPRVVFTLTGVSGGSTVTFANQTTGAEPIDFQWNLGDGTMSTARTPPPKMYAAGNYTITLTATNTFGSDTESQSITIPFP